MTRYELECVCVECHAEILGPPIVDPDALYWGCRPDEWCSSECQERTGDREYERMVERYYGA